MNELSLTHLEKSFDSNAVIRGIDLTLRAGELTAILGDNGAGKSTLSLTLAGLLKPVEGEVIAHDGLAGELDKVMPT